MKFKLSGGNRNASCTLSEKWEGEILYAALHVVLAEEAVPEKNPGGFYGAGLRLLFGIQPFCPGLSRPRR